MLYEDGCILPREQCVYLYMTSWVSIFSTMYGLYMKLYWISLIPFSVFCSSLLYWHKPDYSWRRYVDITIVQIGFITQLYLSINTDIMYVYFTLSFINVLLFLIGIELYNRFYLWESVITHSFIHFIGNINNILLYSYLYEAQE